MVLNRRHDEYQRLVRHSLDSTFSEHELDDLDEVEAFKHHHHHRRWSLSALLPWRATHSGFGAFGRWLRLLKKCAVAFALIILAVVVFTPILNPSYSRRPPHYTGTNPNNEKVFIAANIVDEDLIRGAWGEQMVKLIELLGEGNVYLSIYENDSGPGTKSALQELSQRVSCNSSIISGHIDLDTFPSIQILPNERRVKRIAYLAEVRNKALEPLTTKSTGMQFDKLLFVNDIIFSPKDVADLLFATNIGPDGKTQYHAACAMDFINSFKFYDTFATRDSEGHGVGVPFFPWFTGADQGASRKDVLSGTDAVRVKSCWGGMVAFEAKWFEAEAAAEAADEEENSVGMEPLSFRASDELFWDASECCLIHADLAAMASLHPESWESRRELDAGIYVNPYIRVAYDTNSFAWLGFTRRFERLYTIPQSIVNWLAGRPPFQPRRTAVPGQEAEHREWIYDGPQMGKRGLIQRSDDDLMTQIRLNGHWETNNRIAKPGGFCGNRQLLVLKKQWQPGERIWERIGPPPGANDR